MAEDVSPYSVSCAGMWIADAIEEVIVSCYHIYIYMVSAVVESQVVRVIRFSNTVL